VAARSEAQVDRYRQEDKIQVFGKHVPKPAQAFDEVGFPSYLRDELKKAGFPRPTPIQSQAWPMALAGRDLVVCRSDVVRFL
jgi:ATP-dependent RNA helicase DDX5/DBP2